MASIETIPEYKIIPEWYSLNEVWARFSIAQIKWLIPYLPLLRDGAYPHNTKETGYVDTPIGKKQTNSKANFITASDIYAELSYRIQQCGWEGLITEMAYSGDAEDRLSTMQHIAESLNIDIEEVSWRVNRVLRYIRGRNRKQRSFKDWRFHKKGENVAKKVSCSRCKGKIEGLVFKFKNGVYCADCFQWLKKTGRI